jgi:hypothetical protein
MAHLSFNIQEGYSKRGVSQSINAMEEWNKYAGDWTLAMSRVANQNHHGTVDIQLRHFTLRIDRSSAEVISIGATDARYMGEVIVFIAYEVIQDSATPAIAVIAVVAPFVAQAVITWIMCGYLNLGVGPGFALVLLEDTSGRQGGAVSEDNKSYGSITTAAIFFSVSSFAASLLTGATSSFSL